MKEWLSAILLLSGLSLSTWACAPDGDKANTETPVPEPKPAPNPEPNPDPQPGNSRSLVVYFTCTNTTKGVAAHIADLTGGTLHQIVPEVAYTAEDLNYNNASSRANREQNDASARPGIRSKINNLSDYDVVFLGYPIWWGKAPKILSTFLESYDLKGKTVVPFCTSGSSSLGSSDTDLHPLAPQAVWKPGQRFAGNATKESISNWLNSLNLNLRPDNAGAFALSKGE